LNEGLGVSADNCNTDNVWSQTSGVALSKLCEIALDFWFGLVRCKPCPSALKNLQAEARQVNAQGVIHPTVVNNVRCCPRLDEDDSTEFALRVLRATLM